MRFLNTEEGEERRGEHKEKLIFDLRALCVYLPFLCRSADAV